MLGAGLMQALRQRYPDCIFEGIGGPKMMAQGMDSRFDMERLAVMGLIEPLKRIVELLRIRRTLKQHFLTNPPAVFIGIDAPAFNTGLELALKRGGITTVHYVSPSVWAWRAGRIVKIKAAVDKMLCLLPFEAQIYRDNAVPVEFVGHPLASQLQNQPMRNFGAAPVIALLPGSRASEVALLADVYAEAAEQILQRLPQARFSLAAANAERLRQLQQHREHWRQQYPQLCQRLVLSDGDSQAVMAASDFVICTSGTTTLEAMLLGRPMVIAYKMPRLSYRILRPLVKTRFIGLPNLLAETAVVPEFIQQAATAAAIAEASLQLLQNPQQYRAVRQRFEQLHDSLAQDADQRAAAAIAALIQ